MYGLLQFRYFESSNAVFAALKDEDFDARAIRCMQRKPSGDMLITFATLDLKRKFVYRNVMQIEGRSYAINDGDRRLAYLNIYDAPYELPNVALAHRLEPFCEVLHMRRGKYFNGVFNGNRHFRVRINAAIPSYLRFGKFLVPLTHDGQDHTCRRCNLVGHFANDCTNTFCFNCEELGHMAGSCPNAELYCICKSQGYRARYCPFSWHRTSPPSSPGHNSPPRPDQQPTEPGHNPLPHSTQQQLDPSHNTPRPDRCQSESDPPQSDQQQQPTLNRDEHTSTSLSIQSSPQCQSPTAALDTQGLLVSQSFYDPVDTDDDLVIGSPPTTDDHDDADNAATDEMDDTDDDDNDDDNDDDDDDDNCDDADDTPLKPVSLSPPTPALPFLPLACQSLPLPAHLKPPRPVPRLPPLMKRLSHSSLQRNLRAISL